MNTYRLEFSPGFRVVVRGRHGGKWRVDVQVYMTKGWVDSEALGEWSHFRYSMGVAGRFVAKWAGLHTPEATEQKLDAAIEARNRDEWKAK